MKRINDEITTPLAAIRRAMMVAKNNNGMYKGIVSQQLEP